MNSYIDGDETAGEYLKLKSALHVGGVATGHFGGKFFDYDVQGLEELIITKGEEIIRIFIK